MAMRDNVRFMTGEKNTEIQGAPDFAPGYPSKGARIGPAWRMAWELLGERDDWMPRDDLVEYVITRTDLKPSTVKNLLVQAVQAGLLRAHSGAGGGRYAKPLLMRADRSRRPAPTGPTVSETNLRDLLATYPRFTKSMARTLFSADHGSMATFYRAWAALKQRGIIKPASGGGGWWTLA